MLLLFFIKTIDKVFFCVILNLNKRIKSLKNKKKEKNMKQIKAQYKVLFLVPFVAVVMNACKAKEFVVQEVINNKVFLTEGESVDEIMVDCSKKNSKTPNIQKDFEYFHKGDPFKFKPGKGYNFKGHKVFYGQTPGTYIWYNQDSIQIRKDIELMQRVKAQRTVVLDSLNTRIK